MKLWTLLTSLSATIALAALSLTATAAVAPIQNSKHNLNVTFGANTVTENQVCLPCHAPHSQPDKTLTRLWNHVMPANSYTLFGTGTKYDTGLDQSSRKCLSCHDGTVAPDSYGQGGGIHVGTQVMPTGFVIGTAQNLQHDHPVGVKYPGANIDGTWTTTSGWKDSSKFNTSTYQTSVMDAGGAYTVGGYVNADGTPITPLSSYSKVSLVKTLAAGTTDKGTVVGCTSCHTPHDNTNKFLKISNANSQLCLTCHDK
jgi:predicted CXXCH cytochrome family protein